MSLQEHDNIGKLMRDELSRHRIYFPEINKDKPFRCPDNSCNRHYRIKASLKSHFLIQFSLIFFFVVLF